MRSSLIPDKFAQWNVGRFSLLGRARLTIKKIEGKQFLSNDSITFALIYNCSGCL